MSARIILADDHDPTRRLQRRILEREAGFEVIGEARNGRDVIELVEHSRPDVVVMDIDMSEVNGIEAARILQQSYPDVRIIACSLHSSTAHVQSMFKAGALGYVLKSNVVDELGKAIRTVLKGQVYLDPEIAACQEPDAGK